MTVTENKHVKTVGTLGGENFVIAACDIAEAKLAVSAKITQLKADGKLGTGGWYKYEYADPELAAKGPHFFKVGADGDFSKCRRYIWVITKDHLAEPGSAKGTNTNAEGITGPNLGLPCFTAEEVVKHPDAKQFRMLDDDGEVYYSGVLLDPYNITSGFEPKDHYGEPNAGCTDIQYREGGEWKSL
jgi:hypothetical protein